MNWWQALIGPAGFALVMGTAIGWDRWRAPRRDPRKPAPVVDRRTYRDALQRVGRLDLDDQRDRWWAIAHLTSCREWLRGEIHTGPRRRALWCAARLREVEIRLAEMDAPAGLYS